MTDGIAELFQLTRLAMQLGTVQRATVRPDLAPENDNDHSVSLAWLACSLAGKWYPYLDTGLICQYAVAHDALEVYTGDLPAVTATEADRAAKAQAELDAMTRLKRELPELTWLHDMVEEYLNQATEEAWFTWAVDKLLPKIVIRIGEGRQAWLDRQGLGAGQVQVFRAWERPRFEDRAAEFPQLIELYDKLTGMVDP